MTDFVDGLGYFDADAAAPHVVEDPGPRDRADAEPAGGALPGEEYRESAEHLDVEYEARAIAAQAQQSGAYAELEARHPLLLTDEGVEAVMAGAAQVAARLGNPALRHDPKLIEYAALVLEGREHAVNRPRFESRAEEWKHQLGKRARMRNSEEPAERAHEQSRTLWAW